MKKRDGMPATPLERIKAHLASDLGRNTELPEHEIQLSRS